MIEILLTRSLLQLLEILKYTDKIIRKKRSKYSSFFQKYTLYCFVRTVLTKLACVYSQNFIPSGVKKISLIQSAVAPTITILSLKKPFGKFPLYTSIND